MNRTAFLTGASGLGLTTVLQPLRALSQSDLAAELLSAVESIPGITGVYARTMASGPALFSYNATHSFPSASTIKLLMMVAAFRAADADPAVLRRHMRFDRSELIGGSDFLATQPNGKRFTILQLVEPMITVSDNTASNMLISHFGFAHLNAVARVAGMKNTQLKRHFMDFAAIGVHMDNRTTPADMAALCYQIERGAREGIATVASPEACRHMIRIMLGQTDRNKIPAGLPHGVAVANKTGEISSSRNDVAIVDPFGDSPYVLSVFTDRLDDYSGAVSGIARVSSLIYKRVAGTDL
ncbi:MAG: serine hydrolase [Candidatus Eremiobacteraeota bacterium]|nr:serine hydrolase [Candidatus Eremiobacteraeota bacterium]